ncbi:MAG: response regulator [Bdellovibrionaceae bacterium]|nr:response regulator [Bdellovibrio sp.]
MVTPSNRSDSKNSLAGLIILLVDDSADNRLLISYHLKKHGATVDFAENGVEAQKSALSGSYDIVLMDIQMPVLDGYKATEQLRNQGYTVPIIALTAHTVDEVKQKCITAGYTDVISKPFDVQKFLTKIVSLVEAKKI